MLHWRFDRSMHCERGDNDERPTMSYASIGDCRDDRLSNRYLYGQSTFLWTPVGPSSLFLATPCEYLTLRFRRA